MEITQQHITNANKIMRFQTQAIKALKNQVSDLEYQLLREQIEVENLHKLVAAYKDEISDNKKLRNFDVRDESSALHGEHIHNDQLTELLKDYAGLE